jgi:2-(1,2-epoxy-1,2-dihydrophenyl)acetyl-CoA isomerase
VSYQNIQFEMAGGVARLTLNRPEKLNSFTAAMHEEIRDALAKIDASRGVRVLLITGAGRAFSAGQDLADFAVAPDSQPIDLGNPIERYYAPLVRRLRSLPLPVVCAVNGVAAGAGANLAFACDLVVAKQSASFVEPFCRLGLLPDTGGTYFLPRLIGTARAMGMAMLGTKVSAQQAAEWGLIWKCINDDEFASEVETLTTQLASAPTLALASTKQAIYSSAHATLDEQLNRECHAMRELGRTHDYREGVHAFLDKRTPEFHGR